MATRAPCLYCGRPAYSGGKKPLCQAHFELWLVISHLKINCMPITADTIQAEMIAHTAMGHCYSFSLDQVPELLEQLAPEVRTGVKIA